MTFLCHLVTLFIVSFCVATATIPADQVETTTATTTTTAATASGTATATTRDDGDTMDMPEMTTPNISLEVSETAKDDNAMVTEEQNELPMAASTPSQEHDSLKKLEIESQPDKEIPHPKPRSEEEVPVPKPQPEDQPKTQNPIPEPRSSLSASGNAIPHMQGPRVHPKPIPARSKPIPARSKPIPVPRSKPTIKTGKLLPLREKLADNVNKLLEYPDEASFVPTAEWVSYEQLLSRTFYVLSCLS